jgi:hypothetical protein
MTGLIRLFSALRPGNTSGNIRSTPICHSGRSIENVSLSFFADIRELRGRAAGVGYANVAMGRIASSAVLTSKPLAQAHPIIKRAY